MGKLKNGEEHRKSSKSRRDGIFSIFEKRNTRVRKYKELCLKMNVQLLFSLLENEPHQQYQQARSLIETHLKSLRKMNPHWGRKPKKLYCSECEDEISEMPKKKIYELSDKVLLSFCWTKEDRDIAKRVMGDVRKYLEQITKSEGFDCDVYPGYIHGLSAIYPLEVTSWKIDHIDCYYAAKLAIASFNRDHHETKYEVVMVEKANAKFSKFVFFYITFQARDMKSTGLQQAAHKTFQAHVEINLVDPKEENVCFCRLKA